MTHLPRVKVALRAAGDTPAVSVDDVAIPGVVGFMIRQGDGQIPVLGLELRAGSVDADLPATVTAVAASRGAAAFVDMISAEQLEADILAEFGGLDGSTSTGEAARKVLALYAADFDDR